MYPQHRRMHKYRLYEYSKKDLERVMQLISSPAGPTGLQPPSYRENACAGHAPDDNGIARQGDAGAAQKTADDRDV